VEIETILGEEGHGDSVRRDPCLGVGCSVLVGLGLADLDFSSSDLLRTACMPSCFENIAMEGARGGSFWRFYGVFIRPLPLYQHKRLACIHVYCV